MFGKKKQKKVAPLQAIAGSTLEWVVGGRMLMRTGPNPEVLTGIKTLAETVGAVGQVLKQKDAEQQAQMGQMMQQMMGRRG
jgi:hypothetical protein